VRRRIIKLIELAEKGERSLRIQLKLLEEPLLSTIGLHPRREKLPILGQPPQVKLNGT
jgi:hypothetical protein